MVLTSVSAVGFDLDGTLYESTSEMNDRVQTQIASKLLEKDSSLGNIDNARRFFNERYAEVQSGSGVLKEAGYENASVIMDECLANADVVDLIEPNTELQKIIRELKGKYTTYLLTSSPENLSLSKLEKIGITTGVFDYMFFSDNPKGLSKMNGSAFRYVVGEVGINSQYHVYVGDRSKSDILPANEMGMRTIAVWKNISEADYFIDDINKIGELLL